MKPKFFYAVFFLIGLCVNTNSFAQPFQEGLTEEEIEEQIRQLPGEETEKEQKERQEREKKERTEQLRRCQEKIKKEMEEEGIPGLVETCVKELKKEERLKKAKELAKKGVPFTKELREENLGQLKKSIEKAQTKAKAEGGKLVRPKTEAEIKANLTELAGELGIELEETEKKKRISAKDLKPQEWVTKILLPKVKAFEYDDKNESTSYINEITLNKKPPQIFSKTDNDINIDPKLLGDAKNKAPIVFNIAAIIARDFIPVLKTTLEGTSTEQKNYLQSSLQNKRDDNTQRIIGKIKNSYKFLSEAIEIIKDLTQQEHSFIEQAWHGIQSWWSHRPEKKEKISNEEEFLIAVQKNLYNVGKDYFKLDLK